MMQHVTSDVYPTKEQLAAKSTAFTPTLDETPPGGQFMDIGEFDKVDMILQSPRFDDQPMFVPTRVLGTLSVVAIALVTCSGSPIGSEPVIASAGPLFGLASFLFFPVLVTIPFSYIVAEMCSAFPEDGGFTVWVMNAFGPFWGFQVGYWSCIGGVLNGALLPSVLVKIITDYYKTDFASSFVAWLVKATIAVALTVVPLLGTRNVARVSAAISAIVLVAFTIFTIWAYAVATDFDDLFEIRHKIVTYDPVTKDAVLEGPVAIEWATLINTLYWSFDGIVMISVFGGEVLNPARVYPRAIAITVVITIATYILPMPAGLSSNDIHWSMLTSNSYPTMAKDVGGSFLEALIIISNICATAGSFIGTVYTQAFQTAGMADNQLLPEVFAWRSQQFVAPYVSILVTLALTLPLVSLDFEDLLPMTNAYSAVCNLLVIASAFHLRSKLPYIPRPAKVPGGKYVLLSIAVLPTVLMGYITYDAFTSNLTALIIVIFLVPGLVYGGWQLRAHRNAALGW